MRALCVVLVWTTLRAFALPCSPVPPTGGGSPSHAPRLLSQQQFGGTVPYVDSLDLPKSIEES